jgi:Kef-type K+ transport system membrane component KefB
MNARGSQEIVLGMLALQAKIIDERIFVGLVVMTMVTILIAGPVMKFYLDRDLRTSKKPIEAGGTLVVLPNADAVLANR